MPGSLLQRFTHVARVRVLAALQVPGRVVQAQTLGRVLFHQQKLAVPLDDSGDGDTRLKALIQRGKHAWIM